MEISRQNIQRKKRILLRTFEVLVPLWCAMFWYCCFFFICWPRVRASLTAQLVKNPPAMQGTPVWFLGWEDPGEGIRCPLQYSWASLVVQLVKNLPVMWETWVWSLGWEDTLEKGKATHSIILAWRIPWTV